MILKTIGFFLNDKIRTKTFALLILLFTFVFIASCNQSTENNSGSRAENNATNESLENSTSEGDVPNISLESSEVKDARNKSSAINTITAFDELETGEQAFFEAPNGETYFVASIPADAEIEEKRRETESLERNRPCETEGFDGSQRREVKLSISNAPVEPRRSLTAFLKSLPSDQEMVGQIGRENNKRVSAENRNVIVDAWLYSFSRQSDEDYHLIIGSTNNKESASFINVEISGLPPRTSSSYEVLDKVRRQFRDFVKDSNNCRGGYINIFANKPVFVRITGSLFFDRHHYTPTYSNVGHKDFKPKTYWEIHPITNIDFPKL